MNAKHNDIVTELRDCLEQYDRVFLFCNNTKQFEILFVRSCVFKNTQKKIWIYSCNEVCCSEPISRARISPEEERRMLEIYRTYEFSDRFYVIGFTDMYGSLFQYMDTGILTAEEIIEALLF